MPSSRRDHKAHSNELEPASKEEIKSDYKVFILALPKRYKDAEDGHKRSIYRFLTECDALAELAEEDSEVAEDLHEGEYWSSARQKCSKNEYIKLAVHHMMKPEGKTKRSTASKYVAVLEHLRAKSISGTKLFKKLAKVGIKNIYAESTGHNAKLATKSNPERGNSVQEVDDENENDHDQEEKDLTPRDSSGKLELNVLLKEQTLNKVLDQTTEVLLKITIGGKPVPGKPKGYKRVEGRIYKIL